MYVGYNQGKVLASKYQGDKTMVRAEDAQASVRHQNTFRANMNPDPRSRHVMQQLGYSLGEWSRQEEVINLTLGGIRDITLI